LADREPPDQPGNVGRFIHRARSVSETSTGGIIASLLALGYRVDEIRAIYLRLCPQFFRLCESAARYE
jgi:hypothetical protein